MHKILIRYKSIDEGKVIGEGFRVISDKEWMQEDLQEESWEFVADFQQSELEKLYKTIGYYLGYIK